MEKPAVTEYPVHELIARRWSPRALAPKSVSIEALRSLLEAARWAPSSRNEQPWSFIVARREEDSEFERLLGCLVEGNRIWAGNAGALLLAVARGAFSRNDRPNRHAYHDVGLATANLLIQGTALGLVMHPMGGILPDKAREEYGIPEGHDPVTAIAIGHSGDVEDLPQELREAETAPRKRKPQSEFVFEGRWGRRLVLS